MKIHRIRDVMASVFSLVLLVVFVVGILLALGKRVPVVSDWLGQ